jgi:exopolyphosphatase / guanosine-5'-triphosphate,3'-diphosphate pyrophosphatase
VNDEGPIRYSVIDVGTNSVKLLLAERRTDGSWTTISDRAEVTRLGEGIEATGAIATNALERTVRAFASMVDESQADDVREIVAIGTAGMRMASNANEVVETIRSHTGITIEIISGEEESRLAFLAAHTGLDIGTGSVVVFDTGGGSSQFTFGSGSDVTERFSVNVGAVRFTEKFGLGTVVEPNEVDNALSAIASDLSSLDDRPTPDTVVAMGGAVATMAAVMRGLDRFDADLIRGCVLVSSEIDRQIELFASMDSQQRTTIVGLQPGREEVILAGACIVRTVLEKLNVESATATDRGLRHGVMAERFGA